MRDGASAYAVVLCYLRVLLKASFAPESNFQHISVRQLAPSVSFAARLSALTNLVFHIVVLSTHEKMIPVHANRVITLVANLPFARINFPLQEKRHSVSLDSDSRSASNTKAPISPGVWAVFVLPAVVRVASVKFFVETRDFFFGKVEGNKIYDRLHKLTISYKQVWLLAARSDAPTSRAHSFYTPNYIIAKCVKPYKNKGVCA